MLQIPDLYNLYFRSYITGCVVQNFYNWPSDLTLYLEVDSNGKIFKDGKHFSVLSDKNVDAVLFYYKGKIIVDTNRD
jgi:hypothetical protein